MNNEILSILGGALEALQIFLLSRKVKLGFLFGIASGIFWVIYTLITKNAWGIYVIVPITLTINITGFIKWKKEENHFKKYKY